MQKSKFKMSEGEVTLDLNFLHALAGTASVMAKDKLYKLITETEEKASVACRSFIKGDSEEAYHECHSASFNGKYIVEAAETYARALEAYFNLQEAINREEVKFVRQRVEKDEQ